MSGPQPGPHLDLDRLADLLAGEGGADDVAHVGACSGCAGRLDELSAADAEVAAALAALPPPALPADLVERLSAALAAEPPLTPSRPAWRPAPGDDLEPAGGGSRTVTPFPSSAPRRWQPFAAAAGLLVAAGGLGGALLLGGGTSGDEAARSGAGSAAGTAAPASGLPTSSTGQDYARPGALAAALPALLAGDAARAVAAPSSGFSGDATAEQPPASAPAPTPGMGVVAQPRSDPLARLRDPAELASCLAALLPPDGDVEPLALDYAAYAGQPALTVVLPASGAADKVDVFVVGAQCRPGDDRTLFFTRLDRP